MNILFHFFLVWGRQFLLHPLVLLQGPVSALTFGLLRKGFSFPYFFFPFCLGQAVFGVAYAGNTTTGFGLSTSGTSIRRGGVQSRLLRRHSKSSFHFPRNATQESSSSNSHWCARRGQGDAEREAVEALPSTQGHQHRRPSPPQCQEQDAPRYVRNICIFF